MPEVVIRVVQVLGVEEEGVEVAQEVTLVELLGVLHDHGQTALYRAQRTHVYPPSGFKVQTILVYYISKYSECQTLLCPMQESIS